MDTSRYQIEPIGFVRSALTRLDQAPRQGDEGAPDAWIDISAHLGQALHGVAVGDQLLLMTWLHQAQRDVLQVHPRNDPDLPLTGVFATRSPDRPNPIGLHRVTVREIAGLRVLVGPIEAIDGTPIVDIKPVIHTSDG